MDDILKDGYSTPPDAPGIIARLLPSWVFGVKAAAIIYSGGQRAKRGVEHYGDEGWCQSSLGVLRAIESVGVRVTFDGVENLKKLRGPCVIIGNHMSTLETFVLPCLLRPKMPVAFVVKESLIDYPVFGPIMRSRDPIVVGRSNPREDLRAVLDGGTQRLQAGMSIIIFPQTTRQVRFDPGEFNSIGIKLAKKANVQVLPLALRTDAWTNGNVVKEFGRIVPERPVHFSFGEPFDIKDRGNEEHQAIIDFIEGKLKAWGL